MTWKHPIICSFAESLSGTVDGWFIRVPQGAAQGHCYSNAKAHYQDWRQCFHGKQWLMANNSSPCWRITGSKTWRQCESWRHRRSRLSFSGNLSAPHALACRHSQGERPRVCSYNSILLLKVKSGGTISASRGLTKADFTYFFLLPTKKGIWPQIRVVRMAENSRRANDLNNSPWVSPVYPHLLIPAHFLQVLLDVHCCLLVSLDSLCEKCTSLHFWGEKDKIFGGISGLLQSRSRNCVSGRSWWELALQ